MSCFASRNWATVAPLLAAASRAAEESNSGVGVFGICIIYAYFLGSLTLAIDYGPRR